MIATVFFPSLWYTVPLVGYMCSYELYYLRKKFIFTIKKTLLLGASLAAI